MVSKGLSLNSLGIKILFINLIYFSFSSKICSIVWDWRVVAVAVVVVVGG